MAESIVTIRNLTKSYKQGDQQRTVLDQVNLEIATGEFFVLLGKSGSGKSTLLNLISGIDVVDEGTIRINDVDVTAMNDSQLTRFRREHVGIIFQFFNLIPTLTVLENITLPRELGGGRRSEAEKRALELLERVGLAARADSFPDKLSGGEQQRIAIARALAHGPALVLADEPTGNLDEETGKRVLQLLLELTRDMQRTLIMATHSMDIVPYADRVARIHEGRLEIETPSQQRERFVETV